MSTSAIPVADSAFGAPGIDPLAIADAYIRAHLGEWGLSPTDLDGMTVNDRYTDTSSGITRIYFLQRYRGIPVYNAILNVSINRAGQVFFAGNRFVAGLEQKINTTQPGLSAAGAIAQLAAHLGLPAEALRPKQQGDAGQFTFDKGGLAREDITARLCYQPGKDKALLAWDILLAPVGSFDKWSTRVDAGTGAVLNEFNWTVYCRAAGASFSSAGDEAPEAAGPGNVPFGPDGAGPQYNVWPAPMKNPLDGPRTLVTNPADPLASPFGWHDIDGKPGAEFTVTRGNNVYAYQDRDNTGASSGDEPNGGPGLHFDPPFDPSWEPEQYVDASVVNQFYWTNYMHDFAYHFGFDEAAGNFQKNNYGKGGVANDPIVSVAQAGANKGYSNYPFYSHGNEGTPGTIFMMEFNRLHKYLTVNEPAPVAGRYDTGIPVAGWGAGSYATKVPVTAEVVLARDGVEESSTTDACEPILNTAELAGKIAFVDRGTCNFNVKALRAQEAGAIGVIIASHNNEDIIGLDPGQNGADVHIPVVLIREIDAQAMRPYIGHGLKVSLVSAGQNGPAKFDISLDNGLIAHEYGHGISWRLAGGPNAACFDNPEQMDEGWSDFFALATTVRPGDTGAQKRGIGTYLCDAPATTSGSRLYPYSTDMSASPLTYGDVALSPERHDIGEVWGNMIWDMYWALSDQYGWKSNPYDTTGGNYRAIRLVFEGLKNLPCSPGFVDGRNAILAADEALYGGADTCLLWRVFARRGLGYSASQGSPFDTGDQKEAFDLPPACTNQLLIQKSVTDFIQPGDDIQVTIKVGNYKQQAATQVVVTDNLPAGTSFLPNSSNLPASVQGSTVTFQLGELAPGQEKTITYTLKSSPGNWSKRRFLDEVSEKNDANWLAYPMGNVAPNGWTVIDSLPAHSGQLVWQAREITDASRQALELNPDVYRFHVAGAHPALRFYQRYQTQPAISGGFVEVREVGTPGWTAVDARMLRNGYPGLMDYNTFKAPDVRAFSGNSGADFKATYVDLGDWAGKDIQIRFQFATLDNVHDGFGWLIDDIEFMDLLAYNGEACVSSQQGDHACAVAPEAGTIVDSRAEPLGTVEPLPGLSVNIYPNPASDRIQIALSVEDRQDVSVRLLTVDGRELFVQSFVAAGTDHLSIDTRGVAAGLYLVQVRTAAGQLVEKVVVRG